MKVALLALAGCFEFSPPPPERPAPELRKLADAHILDMHPHLGKQPGLCPGQPGKLFVTATVQWPGSHPVMRSLGQDVDSLDPAAFSITGPFIRADAKSQLFPDPDLRNTIETGFEANIIYTPNPQFTFHETWKPEYSCFHGLGENGSGGASGFSGGTGYGGDQARNGSAGGNGDHGGNGTSGGTIRARVTLVSTKFYPKLIAVSANNTFFLVPVEQGVVFSAAGGPGGRGGSGGAGGRGGDQPTKSVEETDDSGNKTTVTVGNGSVGNGGTGGNGGFGGDGGNGGTVEVIYDPMFPELEHLISVNVDGGTGGEGGDGGNGGDGGHSSATRGAQQGIPGGG
ncbi:MAG TPA: hypothetical protein VGC41_05595, partial [Kofleriaceae bacterium]